MVIILLIIYLLASPCISISDGDTFFHLAVGEYIYSNGFPYTDPFSMHSLRYMPHEWLSDMSFYLIYKASGFTGLFIFQYTFILLLLFVFYKVNCRLAKNKKHIAVLMSIFQVYLLSLYFITVRPQVFTYLLFALEIYLLESYTRNKNPLVLAVIPLFAVLLANFHMGAYPLYFLLMLPYLLDNGIKLRLGRLESSRLNRKEAPLKPLLLAFIISLPAGIINPYGSETIPYFTIIFTSDVTSGVTEWLPPSFRTHLGTVVLLALLAVVFLFMLPGRKINLRSACLLTGLGLMCLSGMRYFAYFIIVGGFMVVELVSELADENWEQYTPVLKRLVNNRLIIALLSSAIILVVCSKWVSNQWQVVNLNAFPVRTVEYLKENTDFKNMRLFNEYFHGGFLMFNGIKVFTDPRGDLYVPQYNPGCTVLDDSRKLFKGQAYYEDVFDKYRFQYALVFKGSLLDISLQRDGKYEVVFSEKDSVLYGRKW